MERVCFSQWSGFVWLPLLVLVDLLAAAAARAPLHDLKAAAALENHIMRSAGWYLKVAAVGASIGAAMELFMIHTGFYEKVTVMESEKRAWESSPEAQAMREGLNPWRKHDEQQRK